MRNIIYFLSLIFAGLLFQTACNKDDNPNPNEINPPDDKPYVDLAKMPYTNLSDYQFFTSTTANFVPNQGVIYYDLNTGLFANYAQKLRYLYLPPNTTATYKNDGVFDFPEGTVIIKHFLQNRFTKPQFAQLQHRNPLVGKICYRMANLLVPMERRRYRCRFFGYWQTNTRFVDR